MLEYTPDPAAESELAPAPEPNDHTPLLASRDSESQGRTRYRRQLSGAWKWGLFLATLSGLLFTANNFFIQYYEIIGVDILLVRSVVQTLVLGTILLFQAIKYKRTHGNLIQHCSRSWKINAFIILQGILTGLMLLFTFTSLAFMPLGDAMALIFTSPLFTIIFSKIFLNIRISMTKMFLCLGFLIGMVMCIQPPILFSNSTAIGLTNVTLADRPADDLHSGSYYIGAALAVGCSISGSLASILIKMCSEDASSTFLVFVSGIAGFFISIIGSLSANDPTLILFHLGNVQPFRWLLLFVISLVGVLAYFSNTRAIKLVTPTTVSVLRSLEIVLAFACQAIFMKEIPNVACLVGAVLIMASILGITMEEKITS